MNKKYYVSMTDSFLSGWGMAENKISKYILTIVCRNDTDLTEKGVFQ